MVETRSQRKQAQAALNGDNQNGIDNNSTKNGVSSSTSSSSPSPSPSLPPIVEKESTNTKVASESEGHAEIAETSTITIISMILIAVISIFTYPESLQPVGRPTVNHVWYFGWISALSTGLGVLPLIFSPDFNTYWVGVTNAIAAGMMIAASYSLVIEGCIFDEEDDSSEISSSTRTIIGAILGLVFILGTKSFLEKHEELNVAGLHGADARKVLLIIFVMTLHSFSEGIGIGVSFGGSNGSELGVFISASLAVHNVPEGLAVAIVLLPRKISKLTASLWCIVTSLPQPLMAVPAFLFVHAFIPFLPVGLGFAGGAMAWVAVFELLVEAYEDTESVLITGAISSLSLFAMLALQGVIDDEARS
mmetsp:Transcript_2238/g.3185  ORF Transcript_2238/g.3185 Transcript_2238/m.3185 type:complete len:363 (+) Transcript_2238:325-1413(+)|eukprot:CAMPEP_0203675150 /NCGR_PEP_ID=MMETSP0090-20130426/19105_1 /ASSEMBLY_ACC=CAM_ASM_001088 /TAXON_ID=426623 /ORGANISM="Chaetoceros affinis, Strain CCMP159" /LENGTH=362 /DNA_ID=CAMNT_0050541239 /DNA_START=272 /DNA_END=1360 /DNA_ORIENTATION=-